MTNMFLTRWAVSALLGIHVLATAAPPVFKCKINGSVTFQNMPCPSAEPREQPSIERLNAEAKKRREAEASKPAASPAPGVAAQPERVPSTSSALPTVKGSEAFRCDGRKYCSQMSSCQEATYFLRNCPGVKMDGNGDGVPCEEQWCGR